MKKGGGKDEVFKGSKEREEKRGGGEGWEGVKEEGVEDAMFKKFKRRDERKVSVSLQSEGLKEGGKEGVKSLKKRR